MVASEGIEEPRQTPPLPRNEMRRDAVRGPRRRITSLHRMPCEKMVAGIPFIASAPLSFPRERGDTWEDNGSQRTLMTRFTLARAARASGESGRSASARSRWLWAVGKAA